jgi:hypothetical protein
MSGIRTRNKRVLLWMISNEKDRWFFAGIIIIAANAGGAWSPMGDVTTTMLWIGHQITAGNIIVKLILPSLACLILPLSVATLLLKPGIVVPEKKRSAAGNDISPFIKHLVFFSGMFVLLSVPVFKALTQLPPFLGMLFALGLMWGLTEVVHRRKHGLERSTYTVVQALRQINTATILFFLGVSCLCDRYWRQHSDHRICCRCGCHGHGADHLFLVFQTDFLPGALGLPCRCPCLYPFILIKPDSTQWKSKIILPN